MSNKVKTLRKTLVIKDAKCLFPCLITAKSFQDQPNLPKKFSLVLAIFKDHPQAKELYKVLKPFRDEVREFVGWMPTKKEPVMRCPYEFGSEFNEDRPADKQIPDLAVNIKANDSKGKFVMMHSGRRILRENLTETQVSDFENFFIGDFQFTFSSYDNSFGKGMSCYIDAVKYKDLLGGTKISTDFFDDEDFDADFDDGNKPTASEADDDDEDLPF